MVKFWQVRDQKYGAFSNFSPHSFILEGKFWRTSEHYFQASKFFTTDMDYAEKIRNAKSPGMAAEMGRDRTKPLRKDWEEVKESEMMKALRAKFSAHADISMLLLSTNEEEIIEDSPIDSYWGVGKSGKGRNRLGVLLMRLRDEIRGPSLPSLA